MGRNSKARKRLWQGGHQFCGYCGCALRFSHDHAADMMTVDHAISRAKGGRTSVTNTVAACKFCNAKKADQMVPQTFSTKTGKPLIYPEH